jgi:error-prone DNA polymerase
MVERTLQVEGEVICVIVKRCYGFTKVLSRLTPSQTDTPQLSTLARLDKNSTPPPQTKRAQVREHAPKIVFCKSKNFKWLLG